ncbi:hypothetical protein [Natrinema salaciae]|uniref:Uncharacterized protein n=1 Tax=Natrinema salaciae TaxID=1186196 RepID=A0A1H9JFQ3_9EURY|nr:hypothetical protein [Natrinema salaciae]SEQ85608.1 hypothetical protein SAMN04489841_2536 [Natrinema salaciae]
MDSHLRRLVVDPAAFFERASPSTSASAGVLVAVGIVCLGAFQPVLSLLRSPVIPDEAVFDAFPPIRYVTAGWDVSLPGAVGLLLGGLFAVPTILVLGPI